MDDKSNKNYVISSKKEKTISVYIFETLVTGFLLFILINIIVGLVSFSLVLSGKDPIFYTRVRTYNEKATSSQVKVYYNFIYKIIIRETITNKTMNIKLWFSND